MLLGLGVLAAIPLAADESYQTRRIWPGAGISYHDQLYVYYRILGSEGGRWTELGRGLDTLHEQLTSGVHTEATDAIRAEANLITKYICNSTGGQPASACQP